MNLKIKNFGKIAEADIKLDGITVICGDNNSGKSTVGKALFGFFNSLYDYKSKIFNRKSFEIRDFIIGYDGHVSYYLVKLINEFVSMHEGDFSYEELKDFFETNTSIKIKKERLSQLLKYINATDGEIINENVFRSFGSLMNGQIKNINDISKSCNVTGCFKESSNSINIYKNKCTCKINEPIAHKAHYINNPFVLDCLNANNTSPLNALGVMSSSIVLDILKTQSAMDEDSMVNILDSVVNKKDLQEIMSVLKQAYIGDTKIVNGKFYYTENGIDIDIRNISTGLKSFALIERLLNLGILKYKDVLILDEPEIHLHSEWQIIYAEVIVLLQKKFDLTILIATHSFQFLESIDFFMKKYEISVNGNYYIPENTNKGVMMRSCGNDASELKLNLSKGTFMLSDMELELDMEN